MYIKMWESYIDSIMASYDDTPSPIDSYYDTKDVKPASIIDTTIRRGDQVDTPSAEYNKDHTDFSDNTAIRKQMWPKGNLVDIVWKVSWGLFRRLRLDD